ncbi:hypothetical protein F5Y03DRAFT_403751 [Xylaria venustula]|nr:hypothetical protein F5Y03DRAFT_403751 [Xylaria venustula]
MSVQEDQTSGAADPSTPRNHLEDTTETHLDELSESCQSFESTHVYSCLDPKGDLRLNVGTVDAKSFTVCSKSLARASPFWDKLLYGVFKEGKDQNSQDGNLEWTIDLPDDDPKAMEVLLNIAHGRFDAVPKYKKNVAIADVYDISVITDKYHMTYMIRPWAKDWARSALYSTKFRPKLWQWTNVHRRLWISWELGDRAAFEKNAKRLLWESSEQCDLRDDSVLEPPEIYGIIERTRLDTIKALLAPFREIIEGLRSNQTTLCQEDQEDESIAKSCIYSMLDKSTASLRRNRLWPIPQPEEVSDSLAALSRTLKRIKIKGKSDKCSHMGALRVKVRKIVRNVPSLLTESHIRHLESRAKRSGI